MRHTLKAGLSASLRACATRSWMSVFVMLAKAVNVSTGYSRRRSPLGSCHSLEGLCKGKYGKRRHEPVDVGSVRRADGLVSGIWRGVRTLDSDKRPHVHPRASYLWTTRSGAKSTIATRLPRNQPASSSFAAATVPWGPLRAVCLPYSFVTTPEVRGLFLASASRGSTRLPEDHSLEVSVPLSDCALKYISTI